MGINKAAVIIGAVLMGTMPAQAQDAFWSFPQSTSGYAEGVSDNGVVSGSGDGVNGFFIWTANGGVVAVGGVPPGNGIGGQGKISNDGARMGGNSINSGTGLSELSLYDVAAGTWTPMGGIGGSSGAETSSSWSISGDGQSIVGLGWVNGGTAHAVQWVEGVGLSDMGSSVAGQSSRASGVDLDGHVVCGWQDGNGRQGAVWVDGVQELIWADVGVAAQEALAVSDHGAYVTGIGYGDFVDPGIAYRYDTVQDLYEAIPNLAAGGEQNMAGAGITASGSTIVGGTWAWGVPATFGTAFIWREGVGTVPLADYLDQVGVTFPPGYNFNFASDISSDGRWITGWGGFGFAADENFVVHIADSVIFSDGFETGDTSEWDAVVP